MIHTHDVRNNDISTALDRNVTIGAAFERFLIHEVTWGTKIIEITPTKLTFKTSIFGATDMIEYTGAEAEMLPLVRAAHFYVALCSATNGELTEHILDQIPKMPGGGYHPHDLVVFGDFMKGRVKARIIALLVAGINPNDWPDHAVTVEDTVVAVCLQLETGESALLLV